MLKKPAGLSKVIVFMSMESRKRPCRPARGRARTRGLALLGRGCDCDSWSGVGSSRKRRRVRFDAVLGPISPVAGDDGQPRRAEVAGIGSDRCQTRRRCRGEITWIFCSGSFAISDNHGSDQCGAESPRFVSSPPLIWRRTDALKVPASRGWGGGRRYSPWIVTPPAESSADQIIVGRRSTRKCGLVIARTVRARALASEILRAAPAHRRNSLERIETGGSGS